MDDAAWLELLRASLDLGLTSFHSSHEYESFGRFCGLLRQLEGRGRVQHIVKLAEPGFGEEGFDGARLARAVDAYLSALGTERLDVVQWMWRGDLKQEARRLEGFADAKAALAEAFGALQRAGKVGAVAPFPYSAGFADLCLDADFCAGLTVYLNPLEQEMLPQIQQAETRGMGIVAIRPFAAGKALEAGLGPADCIRSVLGRPSVATAVVTYSSLEHLRGLVEALA